MAEGPLNEIIINGIIYSVGRWKVLGCSRAMSFRIIDQSELILPVSWRMQNKLKRNTERTEMCKKLQKEIQTETQL